jgi:hypothetical protein
MAGAPRGEVLINTDVEGAPPEQAATLKGNSNRGHEFGTTSTDGEKDDLIEFLKGFGAGASRPIVIE